MAGKDPLTVPKLATLHSIAAITDSKMPTNFYSFFGGGEGGEVNYHNTMTHQGINGEGMDKLMLHGVKIINLCGAAKICEENKCLEVKCYNHTELKMDRLTSIGQGKEKSNVTDDIDMVGS